MFKNIILILIYLPIFGGLYYLNQFAGILQFIGGAIMYLSIFYFFHVVWSHIKKKEYTYLVDYAKKFYISLGTLIYISLGIIGAFGYYQLEYKPLNLEQVTISNGEKTVVFQKMIHIAKPAYYNNIATEIKEYKNNGYVYYFEGVRGGEEENIDKFNQALGIEFDADLYGNLAKLYNLVPQDNTQFLNIENDNDINVDMNIDEIILAYEKSKESQNITQQYTPPVDVNSEIITALGELNSRQLKILQFVNLAFLSALTKNETVLSGLQNSFGNEILFNIILEGRNKVVVQKILNSDDKNIFATYGALHFDGILKLLQESNSNWKIISKKSFFPFSEK